MTARMTVGKVSVQASTRLAGAVTWLRRDDEKKGIHHRRIELAFRYEGPVAGRGDM